MFITLFKKIKHFLFPPLCIFCSGTIEMGRHICPPCQTKLPILSHYCLQCARILPEKIIAEKCGTCLNHPPPFRQTHALFRYEEPIIQLITGLKFRHQLCYALVLGELLKQKILKEWYLNKPLPNVIIPVPLHNKRLQERGFNQALEIARCLGHIIPIDFTGVKRIKNTPPQSHLRAAKRAANMTNAFISSRDYTGLSIAVIDDVMTTGHTVFELCKVLKMHGALHIDVWCCAR